MITFENLQYHLPPLPSFKLLMQWKEAGLLDVRSFIYSTETVFLLSYLKGLAK